MRQTFSCVLGITAGLASISNAWYSNYWTAWDDMMADINCDAPVSCGDEGECMMGYACVTNNGVQQCDDVARYMCMKDCADGMVMNPMKYCDCMAVEARDAMFCADAVVEEVVAPAPVSDEFQTIVCPDGQTLKCFTANAYCVDDSPIFCAGHQVKASKTKVDKHHYHSHEASAEEEVVVEAEAEVVVE